MIITFLKQLIFDGKIPYFIQIKKIAFWVGIISPLSIFFFYRSFNDYAEIGWYMLTVVMIIRPLADILPRLKILRVLTLLRKEFGIFASLLIYAHFVGYLIVRNLSVFDVLFAAKFWDPSRALSWGVYGLILGLPVLISSNKFSMILLKKSWKKIQHLSYPFFYAGGIHIFMVGEDSGISSMILVSVAWLLARLGLKVFQKKN
jgi:DMSO/TMAO reductase YedYZ heme-binding membrane subunit